MKKPQPPRIYAEDQAIFGLVHHIYITFLRETGAEHRDTIRYRKKAAREAVHLIGAGC